jgi:hypothetical protein
MDRSSGPPAIPEKAGRSEEEHSRCHPGRDRTRGRTGGTGSRDDHPGRHQLHEWRRSAGRQQDDLPEWEGAHSGDRVPEPAWVCASGVEQVDVLHQRERGAASSRSSFDSVAHGSRLAGSAESGGWVAERRGASGSAREPTERIAGFAAAAELPDELIPSEVVTGGTEMTEIRPRPLRPRAISSRWFCHRTNRPDRLRGPRPRECAGPGIA